MVPQSTEQDMLEVDRRTIREGAAASRRGVACSVSMQLPILPMSPGPPPVKRTREVSETIL